MNIKKILVFAIISASMISCKNQQKEVKSLNSEIDSVSYAIGLTMSTQLKNGFKEVNEEVLLQAIRNGLDSANLLLDIKEVQNVIRPYFQKQQKIQAKEQQDKVKINFAYNREAGENFLKENSSKKGVITTASGLQYSVMKRGKGASPKATSRVRVHYHGTTLAGEVFDSSVDKKKPADFFLNQVIKGWTEGLQLMKVGAKYKFYVPQELAYGITSKSELIKPFSALVFEVELLNILD
jgi:FKBP-type peptidyl-prolyl cis-trans isomerase